MKKSFFVFLFAGIFSLGLFAQTIVRTQINSDPTGATFSVDGNVIGQTPMEFRFRNGQSYQIIFQKNGYKTKSIIYNGGSGDIYQRLESDRPVEQFYNLNVKSNVNGADVYLNNSIIGRTPLNYNLKAGYYQIRVESNGYRSYTGSIQHNQPNSIFANLEPERFIYLEMPGNAKVWVDGIEQNFGRDSYDQGHSNRSRRKDWVLMRVNAPNGRVRANVRVRYGEMDAQRDVEFNGQNLILDLILN